MVRERRRLKRTRCRRAISGATGLRTWHRAEGIFSAGLSVRSAESSESDLEDVLVIHQLTPGRQRSIAAGLLVAGMMLGAIFAPTTEGRAGRRVVNLRAVEHLPCEP